MSSTPTPASRRKTGIGSVALAILIATGAGWLAIGQQGRQIDDEVIRTAMRTGQEWVTYGGTWEEQRYSPLDQINLSNVERLGPVWTYDIPPAAGNPQNRQEGTPLVYNGIVYSIAPWSVVYAVDARTGKEVWHSDPDVNQAIWQSRICCGVVNRGIALYEGKVIAPVVDGRLRALDAMTGQKVWETRVSPDTMPYTITMAPRVIKGGRVIVGVAGGEYGVRGFFDAYDVNTGRQLWRFYTVPGDPSLGFENEAMEAAAKTWEGEWWKIGGGAPVWNAISYDADADLVYVGTGQPAPWSSVNRGKGDALYSNSILAVRGATGELVWYYQTTPADDWDFDSIADIMLADLEIEGKTRKVLMQAPKNGFFYVIDRLTGELLSAEPYVTVNWASGINMKTGRPVVNPEARYGEDVVNVVPGPGGGHVWPPWSFSPTTGLVYIPATIGTGYPYAADPEFVPESVNIGKEGKGKFNMGNKMGFGKGKAKAEGVPDEVLAGMTPSQRLQAAPFELPKIGPRGNGTILVAWDPVRQEERWRGESAGFNGGGTLATAGNIVFASVRDRLIAYNAANGDKLLELTHNLNQAGPPITFEVDGKQFVAVAGGPPGGIGPAIGGGDDDAKGKGKGKAKGNEPPPQPSKMVVFALDGDGELPPAPPAKE